jgi:hypothetical protein
MNNIYPLKASLKYSQRKVLFPARCERLWFDRGVVPLRGHVGQVQGAKGVAETVAVLGPQPLRLDHFHVQQNVRRLQFYICPHFSIFFLQPAAFVVNRACVIINRHFALELAFTKCTLNLRSDYGRQRALTQFSVRTQNVSIL